MTSRCHEKLGQLQFLMSIESTGKTGATMGRMYLITSQQFRDVVCQENKRPFDDPLLTKSLTKALEHIWDHDECFLNPEDPSKPADKSHPKWYGRLLKLGEEDSLPILSFTAEWPDKDIRDYIESPPSWPYLRTIARGLAETYASLTVEEIVNYLSEKRGVKGLLSVDQLRHSLSSE